MNAKQAKSLRRMARALTDGVPWIGYTPGRVGRNGKARVHLHPQCGRALYKRFKQGYRRLARKEAAAIQLLQKLGTSRR